MFETTLKAFQQWEAFFVIFKDKNHERYLGLLRTTSKNYM